MTESLFDTPNRSTAELSDDGLYRYELTRWWGDPDAFVQRAMTFVMLNPSTADASVDDPTIRRCIGFAKREGLDGIRVVNLYALRSTSPDALWEHPDPVGPDANWHLGRAIGYAYNTATPIICAWGAKAEAGRVELFVRIAESWRSESRCGRGSIPLHCLGTTKSGAPRHPLYVRGDQPLIPWGLT